MGGFKSEVLDSATNGSGMFATEESPRKQSRSTEKQLKGRRKTGEKLQKSTEKGMEKQIISSMNSAVYPE